MLTLRRFTGLALLAAVGLTAAGCGDRLSPLGLANQPPQVQLTSTPTGATGASGALQRLSWSATDPDGRVDHFLVAVDPPSLATADAGWTRSDVSGQLLEVRGRRAQPGAAIAAAGAARDFTVFAVRAVDDRGAVSEPAVRAFFGENVAPIVQIVSPRPSALTRAFVPPTFRVRWQGVDPDGPTGRPVYYKYELFPQGGSDFPFDIAIHDPDSLRRYYAPAFAGWDSVGADSMSVVLSGLQPNTQYLFVITAFDDAGDYTPIFTLNSNMLRFQVALPGTLGPLLTIFNSFVNYTYRTGGISTDPSREIPAEVPADRATTFQWFATPAPGSSIAAYRWGLDLESLEDTKTKHPKDGKKERPPKPGRWTPWAAGNTSATVGPFHGEDADVDHRLYIEVVDDVGFVSLGIVRLHPLRPDFHQELLIVDDTRLLPDQTFLDGRHRAPTGPWPTAAELDTFLYARGGLPWRQYPTGTMSTPGLFAGYAFDTLGTRTGRLDLTVPLSTLARYRHVIWICDPVGAANSRQGNDPTTPITALRYMSGPGGASGLGAYAAWGGKVWLAGGGAAYASLIPWNQTSNDVGGLTFSNSAGELIPGRMMYDMVHWRSEIKTAFGNIAIGKSPTAARYPMLPAALAPKSAAAGDVFPPNRSGQGLGTFYKPVFPPEPPPQPNSILEDLRPGHKHGASVSALDTLYKATGLVLPPEVQSPDGRLVAMNPCMTYYHGVENAPVIFSGFDLWSFRRVQCQQLVDGVLQGIWGLAKAAPAPPPAPRPLAPPVGIAGRAPAESP